MLRMRQDNQLSRRTKVVIWFAFAIAVVAATAILILSFRPPAEAALPEAMEGATITASTNPHKQAPIQNVRITASAAGYSTGTTSQPSGFFRLPLAREWKPGQPLSLTFRAEGYQPLQVTITPSAELMIARMVSTDRGMPNPETGKQTSIGNVRVRYSTQFINTTNIGSIAPTMDVPNVGDEPCIPAGAKGGGPCSPDNKWKASIGTKKLDAGQDNQYINTRISCIAGPCPFTKIEDDSYTKPSRVINVRIRNWSDTTTFLIEAEVSRTQRSSFVREAYPAIFGRALTFTLPSGAEGLSILADLNQHPIVFPIGPALQLSWATCNVETSNGGSKLFRCDLKTGYSFQSQSTPASN